MKHPGELELTLFSGGDLGALAALRVRLHVRSCVDCAREIDGIRAVSAALRTQADELPSGVQWDRLAAEMTANIHLGLEAGECIGPVRLKRTERVGWRAAAVMAGMSAVLIGAWWLNPPRASRQTIAQRAPVEIRTSPGGLEVKENGSAMILMHTRGQQRPIIVSTPGLLRARFVDQDTGQVTINNVYSD